MASKTTAGRRSRTDKGMLRRLKDQLKIQKHVEAVHADRRLLKEIAFYPAHDKRRETPQYKKAHEHLTKTLDLPCLVCGVKNSTLKDKKQNPYAAKAMETHHHIIEWALANAVDPEKFNAILLPHLKHRHPHSTAYQKDAFTAQDVANWVDHSEDNLWVLCDVHHRAQYFGIHQITYPIWCPMDLLREDFADYVKGEIAKEKAASKAPKSRSRVKKKESQ